MAEDEPHFDDMRAAASGANILDFIDALPRLYLQIQNWAYGLQTDNLDEIFNVENAIHSFFSSFSLPDMLTQVTGGLNSISGFALGMVSGIIDFAVAVAISIYYLLYKEAIFGMFKRVARLFFKEQKLRSIHVYLAQANKLFYQFIKAQFLDAIVLAVLATILLLVLDVRFAISLGFFLGVCNMIPRFGSIFGSIIVILLSFITGGATQGILVGVLLTILQQIDGNVIGPKIMGKALRINPILVFFALIVGGAYFGVVGMFVSIPIMAMVKIIFIELMDAEELRVHLKEEKKSTASSDS